MRFFNARYTSARQNRFGSKAGRKSETLPNRCQKPDHPIRYFRRTSSCIAGSFRLSATDYPWGSRRRPSTIPLRHFRMVGKSCQWPNPSFFTRESMKRRRSKLTALRIKRKVGCLWGPRILRPRDRTRLHSASRSQNEDGHKDSSCGPPCAGGSLVRTAASLLRIVRFCAGSRDSIAAPLAAGPRSMPGSEPFNSIPIEGRAGTNLRSCPDILDNKRSKCTAAEEQGEIPALR